MRIPGGSATATAMAIEAVILAGGRGTRLRPFTVTVPKPLLPLGDRPIVDIVLRQLAADGFRHVCFSLGYMAPLFQNFFGDGSALGLKIDYFVEDEPLGTAGALTLIDDLAEHFVVQNGDTLTDLDYRALLDAHVAGGAAATIFSQGVEDFVDYGIVEFDGDRRLTAYHEKPTRRYHVSTGIYALSRSLVQMAAAGVRLDMPDLLRDAMEAGMPVACHVQEGAYWRDIGRFDHYEAATKDFEADPSRFLRTERR